MTGRLEALGHIMLVKLGACILNPEVRSADIEQRHTCRSFGRAGRRLAVISDVLELITVAASDEVARAIVFSDHYLAIKVASGAQ